MSRSVTATEVSFVVPMAYLRGRKLRLRGVRVRCGAYAKIRFFERVEVCIVHLRHTRVEELQQRVLRWLFSYSDDELLVQEKVIVEGELLTLVVPADTDLAIQGSETKRTREERLARATALQAYLAPLTWLARVTGRRVTLHTDNPSVVMPGREGIDIYTGACPPGLSRRGPSLVTAFGLRIRDDGRAVSAGEYTEGRGVILKDGDGERLLQIVDATWYILFPVLTYYNPDTSLEIFQRLLAMGVEQGVNLSADACPLNKRVYGAFINGILEELPAFVRERISTQEMTIAQLEHDLAVAYGLLGEYRKNLIAHEALQKNRLRELKPTAEYERLSRHPLVERLELCNDGLHVYTKAIVIAHCGHSYQLGRFVIRLNKNWQFGVWALERLHPQGRQHPHIGLEGSPCLGNVGGGVARAIGELRFADAIELILRWLAESYTPHLAEIPIEEWPLATEESWAKDLR